MLQLVVYMGKFGYIELVKFKKPFAMKVCRQYFMFLTFDIHENGESQKPKDDFQRSLLSFQQAVEIPVKGFKVQLHIIFRCIIIKFIIFVDDSVALLGRDFT
jgi:hypothetical protein